MPLMTSFLVLTLILLVRLVLLYNTFNTTNGKIEFREKVDLREENIRLYNTTASILSKVDEISKHYKGVRNQKEAVVLTSRFLDECGAGRLAALVASSRRDVWFLHDHASLDADDFRLYKSNYLMYQIPSLRHAQQIKSKERLSFDSHISTTKSSFLRFLIKNGYKSGWIVEDDVFYTGPWSDFFDSFLNVEADLLAVNNWNKGKEWWRDKPCYVSNISCADIYSKQTYWMTARVTKKFAEKIIPDVEKKYAYGHHEALTAPYANANGFIIKNPVEYKKELFGTFHTAHWGKWNNSYNQSLENLSPVPSKIYHPVKCLADPSLGQVALKWAGFKHKDVRQNMVFEELS